PAPSPRTRRTGHPLCWYARKIKSPGHPAESLYTSGCDRAGSNHFAAERVDLLDHRFGYGGRVEVLTPFCNTIYRAEFQRMPGGTPGTNYLRVGLWRVMIYDDERFVRRDREWITYSMAKS